MNGASCWDGQANEAKAVAVGRVGVRGITSVTDGARRVRDLSSGNARSYLAY
ncbi:MAG: hypothetical protein WCH96_10075 [Betaproteobacteria bacterium]